MNQDLLNEKRAKIATAASRELLSLFPALRFGRFLDQVNARQHFVDAGTGEPILCVHGNPTWSFYWRAIIEAFRDQRRVVAVDHVGCGLSDKPQRYSYCLEQHIENLCRLIEELDLKNITLVVHDWGGPIGVGAAVRLPKRFSRIVLTNTACFPPPFIPWRILACRIPVLGTLMMRGANVFSRAATKMATTRRGGLEESAWRGLLAPYDNWHNRVGIDRFVFDIPLSRRNKSWQLLKQLECELPKLSDKPCLMMWGMRDWCFRPECLRQLQRLLPNAKSIEFADAGHYLMEDAARGVVDALAAFMNLKVSSPERPNP